MRIKVQKTKNGIKDGIENKCLCLSKGIIPVLFLAACIMACSACSSSNEQPDIKHKITAQKKKHRDKSRKIKEEKAVTSPFPIDEYSYDATGKPDPFVPLITEAPSKRKGPVRKRKKITTPLERYAIEELKLVAIISTGNNATAMLEDPAKYGYIVKDGMHIGKNDGIIKKITENGLIIEEKVYNSDGKLETKISTLTIENHK